MSDIPVIRTTSLSRLPASLAQLYQARLQHWSNQFALYEAQIAKLLESPVESYSFSGGEGQQTAKRRSLKELQDGLSYAEKMYGYYWKRLHGYGNVNMSLRRR